MRMPLASRSAPLRTEQQCCMSTVISVSAWISGGARDRRGGLRETARVRDGVRESEEVARDCEGPLGLLAALADSRASGFAP